MIRFQSDILQTYVERIRDVPRARELRWFHTMVQDEHSEFYEGDGLDDLLERVVESFSGPSEE